MQLSKKKQLAAKVLKTGKNRIGFVETNLEEIKEAITRQDIIDLHNSGAIFIKPIKGRKKIKKRKHRRRTGKIKKKIKRRKQDYIKLTRKLRKTAKGLLGSKKIEKDKYKKIRKMIRGKKFRSKGHLNESLEEI